LKELKEWDDLKNSKYKSAVERYEAQIGCFPDPSNPMLALSPSNPADEDQSSMVPNYWRASHLSSFQMKP
jgi:hypothetical protein